ncbi:M48 family metallopeptidase [Actinomycetaceae bacterium TAE3-ERU4]|nr:M48 family metallopeptidase [Actinomycetaceae bacterium TAE3-ERU4]
MRGEKTEEYVVGKIRVLVTYKKVKNLNLRIRVRDGKAIASVPRRYPPEKVHYWLESQREWLEHQTLKLAQMRLRQSETVAAAGIEKISENPCQQKQQREQLHAKAMRMIEIWAPKMGELRPSSLTIRIMRTRWGSCNHATRSINLNLELLARPEWALEYVIVHELAHLYHRGHGPQFWEMVEDVLPDWKERRRALRKIPPI